MPREDGQFKPGNLGKPKGATNLFSRELKADIRRAYQASGKGEKGGIEFWRQLKRRSPITFAKILAGMLPKEITADLGDNALTVVRRYVEINGKDSGECGAKSYQNRPTGGMR